MNSALRGRADSGFLLATLILAGCSSTPTPENVVAEADRVRALELHYAPTASPEPTRSLSPSPTAVSTPIPWPVEDGQSLPPDDAANVEWNPPPYPAPLVLRPEDHFYFARPIPSGEDIWLHPRFRYGNTHFEEEPTHTGVDIVAAMWTPVLAAGPGEVVWLGYGLYRGLYDESDPYGLAVAIEHDFGYEGQSLFTVYSHLAVAEVWDGQRVETGTVVGKVGDSGHASGPHLHFEVRLGENRYFSTANPELWLVPYEGHAVFVGRILSTSGLRLHEQLVQLENLESGKLYEVWTYAADTVHPDQVYQENLVVSNLPAGPYQVSMNYVGNEYSAQLYLYPGQSTLVTFRGRKGFELER